MTNYYDVLKEIHGITKPKIYIEIGVRNGESFQLAFPSTLCLGVDPQLEIKFPINANSKLFHVTSDEFFTKYDLNTILNNRPIELSFIDGMHLFEYALRDFINLEKYSSKRSLIVLHDCLPVDRISSQRNRTTQIWTGDVWKLIPCLRKYRPDLDIKLFDVSPSGLAVITNLNPKSKNLYINMKNICDEFISLDYSYFEEHKTDKFITVDYRSINKYIDFPAKRPVEIISNIKNSIFKLGTSNIRKPKCLCVLLCYNDSDILPDVIDYMLSNHHDIIAWDHGSDDNTSEIINKYKRTLKEHKFVPRAFDFYNLYPLMSHNIIDNYVKQYDWISWPDDDEILEGPDREKTYYEYICDAYYSAYNFIKFNNYNYWFTEEDDKSIISPLKRIKRYSIFPDCAPRIRSWRASVTNIREFNHNLLDGEKYPTDFNLRHYPMRTFNQMMKRVNKDRAGMQRGNMNYHYNNMKNNMTNLNIESSQLHFDDGKSRLNPDMIINWHKIYGYPVK
jgi:hypothetical protein